MIRALLGAASLAAVPAFAASAEPAVAELAQYDARDQFFHPAGEALCFSRSGGGIRTNALVVGFEPSGIARDEIPSLVTRWVDGMGHVHTVDVLRRQLAYSRLYVEWLQRRGAPTEACDAYGCELRLGWKEPVFVPNPTATGIFDRDTALIPFYGLALRLDETARRHHRAPGADDPLRRFLGRKLAAARETLGELRQASLLPVKRPKPPPAGARRRSAAGHASGLVIDEADLPPWVDRGLLSERPKCYVPKDASQMPEKQVLESVDPGAEGFEERVRALASAQQAAEKAIEDVDLIAHELLGPAP